MALIYSLLEEELQETDVEDQDKILDNDDFNRRLNEISGNISPKKEQKLNINFEDIENGIKNDELITDELINECTSAYFVARLTTIYLENNIDSSVNNSQESQELIKEHQLLQEAKGEKKFVVRSGKMIEKIVCPKGFKNQGGKCVKMDHSEIRNRVKGAKKAAKTRVKNYGHNKASIQKSLIASNKLRERKGSIMSQTRSA